MKLTLLKAGCILIYAVALAGAAGLVPGAIAVTMARIAGVMLVIHVLELVFMLKYVRLYRGPLAVSVVLTLLFGILHWKPMKDAQAA